MNYVKIFFLVNKNYSWFQKKIRKMEKFKSFQESYEANDNQIFKESYYNSFFKDSSFFYKYPDSLKNNDYSYFQQKNPIMFMKCQKHPMFDLLLICTEKKCNSSPAICKICLTDSHLNHNSVTLVDFLSSTKKNLQKIEKNKEKKFVKLKENIEKNIENLCLEYSEIIDKMKSFIDHTHAKMKSDFNTFWKSLQEYPPFKFTNIINKIQNNSINTIKVLNSSLNYLLDYENPDNKLKNEEHEKEIEIMFDAILQNVNFNEDKLKQSKKKIEEIINSIILDKIPIFHSNSVAKNDSMVLK